MRGGEGHHSEGRGGEGHHSEGRGGEGHHNEGAPQHQCILSLLLSTAQTLQAALSRCVSVLSQSSEEGDMAVQVCRHISWCFRVCGQFEACREALQEHRQVIKDVCRCLYFKVGGGGGGGVCLRWGSGFYVKVEGEGCGSIMRWEWLPCQDVGGGGVASTSKWVGPTRCANRAPPPCRTSPN